MAKVDVVMPVRDGGPYIEEAIRSVIAQEERDWRLLVLNHASTDTTPAIIEGLARQDPRIRTASFGPELTVSDVRNRGFAMTDAPFVMLHDADDVSLPTRMGDQVAALTREPALALVGGSYDVIDAAGRTTGRYRLPSSSRRVSAGFLFSNPIAHPTVMLRSRVFADMGAAYGRSSFARRYGLPQLEVTNFAEDYLLFGELAMLGLCANVDRPVIRYRRHAASIGANNLDRQIALSVAISRHLMSVLAAEHGLAWRDPVPFSNFGARLAPMAADFDGADAFAAVRETVARALGDADEVRRELAFRQVLVTRRPMALLARFARFRAAHTPDGDETATIRSYLLQQARRVLGASRARRQPASSAAR